MNASRTLLLLVAVVACGGRSPGAALRAGALAPCPVTPNCVSTESADPKQRMPPISFGDGVEAAQARLAAALRAQPRVSIVAERPGYLRAEGRSRVFRFVDDMDFVIDSAARVIRFRAASRVGHDDWGVNRARMSAISARAQFLHSGAP